MPKGVELYTRAKRDRLLLAGLARGKKGAEIARDMRLTHGTVRIYICQLMENLGARTRTEAVFIAIERGLVPARGKR